MTNTESADDTGEPESPHERPPPPDVTDRLERLETIVADQQDRLDAQRARLDGDPADDSRQQAVATGSSRSAVTRRDALATGGLLALLGVGTGAAGAQAGDGGGSRAPIYDWQRDVDANGHALTELGSLGMAGSSTAITAFDGANLAVDADGVLNAAFTDTDTRTNVSDDGVETVENVTDINFGANLDVATDDDGSVTVTAASSQWADTDSDGLLETTADGIDVSTVDTGTLAVDDVGVSAFRDGDQTIPTHEFTKVAFNRVLTDHFDGFDTSTHEYTVPADGHYHVSASVQWRFGFSGGTRHTIEIAAPPAHADNPRLPTQAVHTLQAPGDAADVAAGQNHITKTVYGLSAGDRIAVFAGHNEGEPVAIGGASTITYLTVDKVG